MRDLEGFETLPLQQLDSIEVAVHSCSLSVTGKTFVTQEPQNPPRI
jgi:hypothetical protein